MTRLTAEAGLVLAGGRSRRFGSEKALAELGGQCLLRRAIEVLRPLASNLGVSAVAGSGAEREARAMGFPVMHDREGLETGPLLGVLSGLAWAQAIGMQKLITLPCDVICVPRDALASLAAADGAAYIATARGAESLCAIWPVAGLPKLEAMLARGHPAARDALRELDAAEIFVAGDDVFLNINTQDDLARAERLIARN
jgi:molybdenum cofactor guanylyltransferase